MARVGVGRGLRRLHEEMKEGRNDFGKCVLLASYQQFELFWSRSAWVSSRSGLPAKVSYTVHDQSSHILNI